MESLRDKIIDAGLLRGLAATRNDEVFSFFVMAKRAALWPSSTYNLIPKGFFLEKIFLIGRILIRLQGDVDHALGVKLGDEILIPPRPLIASRP